MDPNNPNQSRWTYRTTRPPNPFAPAPIGGQYAAVADEGSCSASSSGCSGSTVDSQVYVAIAAARERGGLERRVETRDPRATAAAVGDWLEQVPVEAGRLQRRDRTRRREGSRLESGGEGSRREGRRGEESRREESRREESRRESRGEVSRRDQGMMGLPRSRDRGQRELELRTRGLRIVAEEYEEGYEAAPIPRNQQPQDSGMAGLQRRDRTTRDRRVLSRVEEVDEERRSSRYDEGGRGAEAARVSRTQRPQRLERQERTRRRSSGREWSMGEGSRRSGEGEERVMGERGIRMAEGGRGYGAAASYQATSYYEEAPYSEEALNYGAPLSYGLPPNSWQPQTEQAAAGVGSGERREDEGMRAEMRAGRERVLQRMRERGEEGERERRSGEERRGEGRRERGKERKDKGKGKWFGK